MDESDLRLNRLLRLLEGEELRRAEGAASVLAVARGEMFGAVRPDRSVLFPLKAVFALVATEPGGGCVAVAPLGSEGASGLAGALGASEAELDLMCVFAGTAARLPGAEVARFIEVSPPLRRSVIRYLGARDVMVSQIAVCSRFHRLDARLARVVLTAADRTGQDGMAATQETLAMLLGVSRPKLSRAMGSLRRNGLLESRRGPIRIVDAAGLREAACSCYETIRLALADLEAAGPER